MCRSEKVSNTSTNENRNNKRNYPKFMGAPSHESWRGAIYLCVLESEILYNWRGTRPQSVGGRNTAPNGHVGLFGSLVQQCSGLRQIPSEEPPNNQELLKPCTAVGSSGDGVRRMEGLSATRMRYKVRAKNRFVNNQNSQCDPADERGPNNPGFPLLEAYKIGSSDGGMDTKPGSATTKRRK